MQTLCVVLGSGFTQTCLRTDSGRMRKVTTVEAVGTSVLAVAGIVVAEATTAAQATGVAVRVGGSPRLRQSRSRTS